MADQTLRMNSSGNSKSPRELSIARAKLSASGLFLPVSTMTRAAGEEEGGGREIYM